MNTFTNSRSSALTEKAYYPWLVVLLCAAFLFYKYLLQVSPSVMTTQLMQNFHVNGAGLGNLAASYFYSYLVAQLFVGPLLDRYSPRLLTALAMLLCGVGVYAFAQSDTLLGGMLSRGCVGVGAAFATVSYLKMASVWFKPNQFAFVSGLLATAAMAGSMMAQVPMELLVAHTSWQAALECCAVLGVVLAVLFYMFARVPVAAQQTSANVTSSLKWRDFASVLKLKHNWLLMLYSGFAFSPLAVFGGLWGNPFLEEAFHFSPTTAASVTTMMFLGLAAGAPFFALLSNRFKQRYFVMQLGLWLSLLALTAVIYLPSLTAVTAGALLFLFGFGVGAFMLCFTVGKELNSLALAATVVALLNTGDAVLSAFFEPFVGKLLDVFWDGSVVNGVHHFNVHAYHVAFVALPVCLLLASASLLPLKNASLKTSE